MTSIGSNASLSIRAAAAAAASLFLFACAAPVGVTRMDARHVHRQLTASIISSGELSGPTQIVLRRHDLIDVFPDDPEAAIARLRADVDRDGLDAGERFALSELCYAHAENTGDRRYYLAAAVYASAFIFPDDPEELVDRIDPRVRVACDIYNMAIARAFASADGKHVELRAGQFPLPYGSLTVDFDPAQRIWGQRLLVDFIPSAELAVHGLRNRYRRGGIGTPLAARTIPLDPDHPGSDFIAPYVRVPCTAVLEFDSQSLLTAAPTAVLKLYAFTETESVALNGHTVPLESEPSAALATSLAESRFWTMELQGLLGKLFQVTRSSHLYMRAPHRPGRIPVVFVHGTASSPGRWADMVNDLEAERDFATTYEPWFFVYDSGNPIAYSAMILRESLIQAVDMLDPRGTDPCLRQMVVVGHSQGGLLTKMTVIRSGDAFWRNISSEPFEETSFSGKTRDLLRRALFVEPLPFVQRVIFIATPHRGSFLAGPQIVRRLAERLIQLPADIVELGAEIVRLDDAGDKYLGLQRIPTSIDNMSPGNRFIRTLSEIPIADGVKAHSIIAVRDDGPLENGDDGVVEYKSAQLDGVDSELVVRSSHSCQANPHTIGEVSRILKLHRMEANCSAVSQ